MILILLKPDGVVISGEALKAMSVVEGHTEKRRPREPPGATTWSQYIKEKRENPIKLKLS